MRIRTKLELMAVLPAIVSIFVCAILYLVYGNVDRLSRSGSYLQKAVQDIFDLKSASYEYVQAPTPASASVWVARYQSLGRALTMLETADASLAPWVRMCAINSDRIFAGREGLSKKIQAEYEALSVSFRAIETASLKGTDIGTLSETQTLQSTLHLISGDILTLASITQNGSASIQTTGYMIIVFVCVMLCLVVLAISIPFGISLSNETRSLLNAIHSMSRGEGNQQLSTNLDDEFGDIARAFTAMRAQVFESKQALANQLEEHRKMAASLQATNFQLSDVLSRLERAKHQAIQQERLQAIHQLAYGVVHDLNSALTPILGMTEFLNTDAALLREKPDVAEALGIINEAARNCRRVVMNLVELVHPIRPDATERVNVTQIIQTTLDITRPRWRTEAQLSNIQIDVKLDLASTPVHVDCRPSDLQECIAGLIFNAAEAMPKGGTLTLSAHDIDGQVVISVADTGVGMSPDVRARCFEPFYSTKAKDATGMGLTSTRSLIARYRGTVELASEPGKGTTVTIRMPKSSTAAAGVTQAAPAIQGPPRILVVDDEEWAVRILRKHLTSLGCEVVSATNGLEAIDKFKPNTFHTVMLDRAMPAMNGDELAARLRRLQPDLLIIMVTGFADLMQGEENACPHVDLILAKPFTQRELSDLVSRCQSSGWKSPVA